jgi:hypothetical protein
MIKKIISGGQTGADRAALDVAIKLNIPHGGWIPKGRKTENGILPDKYQLKEMSTASYPARTEQNVIDSDGTLIVSHGKLSGGSDYTRKMTLKHHKQLLYVDLNNYEPFDAASLIASWIGMQKVQVLNVAGPRASKDPEIYADVFKILEQTIQILMDEDKKSGVDFGPDTKRKPSKPPITVDQAVVRLISELSFKDKTTIANMAEVELSVLHTTVGEYIRNEYGLWSGNKDLMTSCCFFAKRDKVSEDDASSIIIRELWKRLRVSHKLRVVK